MNISHLQGAQSFQVTTIEGKLSKPELKALENNGKVDLVIEDGEQTHIVSGEKIDIEEFSQRMGKADPNFKIGPYQNNDLRAIENLDGDKDGVLTESETRHSFGEALGKGLGKAGSTISFTSQLGSMYGAGYGGQIPVVPNLGAAVGVFVGGVVGGVAGLVASPFTGIGKTYTSHGSNKDVHALYNTNTVKDIR